MSPRPSTRKRPELLFDANPPDDAALVVDLFWNRERELAFGLRMLREGTSFPKVLAVHGPTRSGKSHLVLRLLAAADAEGLPYAIVAVNANNRGTAPAVLEEAFCQLSRRIRDIPRDAIPDGEHDVYDDALLVLGALEPLVLHEVTEVERVFTQESAERLMAGLKLVPPGFEATAAGELSVKDTTVRRWKASRPDVRDLVELLRYECEAIARLLPGRRVLLFVDDLDLLDQPGTGAKEASELVGLLQAVADTPAAVVLVTVRGAWFNGREKDFKDFLRVGLLDHRDLVAVHQRHVDVLNGGEPVFDADGLEWLERGADGKVGIYLSLCYRLWQAYGGVADSLVGKAHVRRYVLDHLEELRRDPDHVSIVVAIEKAVALGQLEVTFDRDLRDTDVIFRVLTPLPGRPDAYGINPIYADVLRERAAGRPA